MTEINKEQALGHNSCGAVQTPISGVEKSKYIEVIADYTTLEAR